ncbi:coiled-coil domain-containing protein mad1 [Tilletia horrida]|nr:coiled-coil domain-containing protein mad1 [Tilletia horrida]
MSADRSRASFSKSGNNGAGGSNLPLPQARRAPSPSSAAFASTSRIPTGLPVPSARSGFGFGATSASASTGSGIPAPGAGAARVGASRVSAAASAAAAAAAPSSSRIGAGLGAAKRTSAAAGLSSDGPGSSKRLAGPPVAAPSLSSSIGAAGGASAGRSSIPQRPASRASMAPSSAGSESNLNTSINGASSALAASSAAAALPDELLSGPPPSESAEYMLSMMKNEYERRFVVAKQEYTALERQLAAKARDVSKAERRAADVAEEWERERTSSAAALAQLERERETLQAEAESWRTQHAALSAEHETLLAETQAEKGRMHDELLVLRSAQAQWEAERAKLNAEVRRAEERADRAEEERGVLEKVLEDDSAKSLEREEKVREAAHGWGTREEAEAVEKEIKRQAIHIRQLEETIAKLQAENKYHMETVTNVELLREEKRSLESKLRGMDELRQSLAAAEAKAQEAAEQNQALTSAVEETLNAGPDANLVSQILESETIAPPPAPAYPISSSTLQAYLRQSLAVLSALSARSTAASQSIAEMRARLTAAEEVQIEWGQARDSMGRELAEEKARSTRAVRAEERLKSEVGRFKEILASYEAEQQTFKAQGASGFDEAAAGRIKALEELVEETRQQYESQGAELERTQRELAVAQEGLSLAVVDAGAAAKVKELNHALEMAKAEYEQLFKDAENLSRENDKLLERVGRGEFDTSKEKCWTLTDNPASRHFAVRTATLEALKKENEDLLKRLDELNEKLSKASASATSEASDPSGPAGPETEGGAALVPRQVVENYKKDIQDLQKSIQAKDKAMLRLKQVFTAKATEFREVVQSLFGYKIRFLENGKVKLSSVYALSSKGRGTNIIFQSNPDNTAQMQLLLGDDDEGSEGGGALKDLRWLKDYWLGEERHNVPCFLAALSKELYEAVTRVEKRGTWRLESGEGEQMQE